MPPDPAAALTGLARIRTLRDQLDAEELDLLSAARAGGVTWARIAATLGVTSRQAAEQRHARLLRTARMRQHTVDMEHGPAVAELRAAAADLRAALAAAGPDLPHAGLTLATLDSAITAPPGALFALAAHVAADLTAAHLTTAGPATADPTTPGPATADPAAADPTTPGPAAAGSAAALEALRSAATRFVTAALTR